VRAPSPVVAFVPGLGVGAALLVVALLWGGRGLGAALFLAGASYVAATAAAGATTDATAPLVAALLLLCGELAAWSLDERFEIRPERVLTLRRGAAVAVLAFAGLAVAALVVSLSAGRCRSDRCRRHRDLVRAPLAVLGRKDARPGESSIETCARPGGGRPECSGGLQAANLEVRSSGGG